ncbi:unnamed protein product, partial [Ectocarpus sp. 13 AM-2016]
MYRPCPGMATAPSSSPIPLQVMMEVQSTRVNRRTRPGLATAPSLPPTSLKTEVQSSRVFRRACPLLEPRLSAATLRGATGGALHLDNLNVVGFDVTFSGATFIENSAQNGEGLYLSDSL